MALIPVIADLISKYINGEITVSEEIQLEQWKNSWAGNRKVFDELTNDQELLNQLSELHTAKAHSWATVTAAIQKFEANKKLRTRRKTLVLVAASFIILLGLMAYWFLLRSKTVTNPSLATTNKVSSDAAPGHAGAILTLQDGRQMILDSLQNGTLRAIPGAIVHKSDSALIYAREPSEPVYYHTLTTPLGRQYSLTLSDGTKVWLNAGSSVKFPTRFQDKERTIEITGEVYLEVAKDPAKPFRVMVSNTAIEVLGTHFNINAYPNEPALTTTLLEGVISMTKPGQSMRLKAGQQVKVQKDSLRLVSSPDLEQAIAWKNGYFSFHSADIKEIMRQLARWYDLEIIYKGEMPSNRYEGAIDDTMSLMNVLKALEVADLHFQLEGRKLIISP